MQNIKAMSLDNIIAVNNVSRSKASGQGGDFQNVMNNTGKASQDADTAKAATVTKVSGDVQLVENVDSGQENDVVSNPVQADGKEGRLPDMDIAAVEQTVKELVKSILQVDDETLETVMSEMGISPIQLLDPAVLQEFMMNVNPGSDVTDFLTSETMLADFTELMQTFEDIDWEALTGMNKEDFIRVLEEVQEQLPEEGSILPEEVTSGDSVEPALPETEQETAAEPQKEELPIQNALSGDLKNAEDTKTTQNREQAIDAEKTPTLEGIQSQNSTDAGENTQPQLSQQGNREPVRHVSQTDSPVVTVMDFVDNMMQATDKVQVADAVKMQQMIDIVNQVVEKIHSSVREDTTTMEMQLNPESLGKVLLSVSNRNGVMTASFTVQTTEAKEALESQMYQLRDNLEQKNLKVESVEVSVSDFAFSQSSQADTSDQKDFRQGHGKRMRFQFDEEQDEISAREEAEQVRRSVMRDSGSQIDYTA